MRALLLAALLLAACAHDTPMRDAVFLFRDGEYDAALESFTEIAKSSTDERERQRATYFMGATLFHLKEWSRSATTLLGIVAAGPSHPYFKKSMTLLALMAGVETDPEGVPLRESLARLPDATLVDPASYDPSDAKRADMSERLRDNVVVAVGRWCLEHGQIERGRKLLAVPAPGSIPRKKTDALLQR